jgi:hypothetical protein
VRGEQADQDGTESDTEDVPTVNPVNQVQESGYQPRVVAQGFPTLVSDDISDEELFFVGAQACTRHGHTRRKTVTFYQARAFTRVHQLMHKHTIFSWSYMQLKYKFDHALTDTAFNNKLDLDQELLDCVPNNAPPSLHVLMKIFGAVPAEILERHACPSCSQPLGVIPRSQWRQMRNATCPLCGDMGKHFRIRGADRIVPSQRYYNLFQDGEPIRLWLGDKEWASHLGTQRREAARDRSTVVGSAYGRALNGLFGGALDTPNTAQRHFGLYTIGTIQHIPSAELLCI